MIFLSLAAPEVVIFTIYGQPMMTISSKIYNISISLSMKSLQCFVRKLSTARLDGLMFENSWYFLGSSYVFLIVGAGPVLQ